jgi:hypothetical protein
VGLVDNLAQLGPPSARHVDRLWGLLKESESGAACGLNPREDLRPYRQGVPFIRAECCRLVVQEVPDCSEQVGHAGNPRIGNAFNRAASDSFKGRSQ